MYYLLSLLTGVLISVMIAFNGGLTEQYGVYSATVIIHVAGLLMTLVILAAKREWPFAKAQAWFLYLGGAIGVVTTVFNCLAFGRISVSSILALGLFGQSVTGLVIDQYGLLDMPRHPFKKRKILGLLLILCGIASMTNEFDLLPVILSFATGVTIVVSRTTNARLAENTSVLSSTFFNYIIGIIVAVPVCLAFGRGEPAFTGFAFSPNIVIYLGGIAGVCVVLLSNVTVARVSAFFLSLLVFIGQVFSGLLVDMVLSQTFSPRNMIGATFVTAGLCVNLLLDRKAAPTP